MRFALTLLLALLSVASTDTARAEDNMVDLRIMTFNIWLGGDQVNLNRTIDAIRAAGADVVLLQEPDGQTRRIAALLGWPHASDRRHIVSRFPLFEPGSPDADYSFIELVPGGFVAAANIHLTSEPYGPNAVRDGKSPEDVLTIEKDTRLSEIEPYIAPLSQLAAAGTPVFIGGDFNAPSHLDWTEATKAARPQVRFALEWPVSKALADAGFRDSFREVHPDPTKTPGITWPAGYPVPHLEANEVFDRIDQLYALGNATTVASQIIGEPGGQDVATGIAPWPSDHRAVVSTFKVAPGPAPAMVSIEPRVVSPGDALTVRVHAATADGRIEDGRVAVVAAGQPAADPLMLLPTNSGSDRRSVMSFGTSQLTAGVYDAVLSAPDGSELTRASFWVKEPGTAPTVAADRADYADNEPIVVSWTHAPGHRKDWLGIFRAGDPDQSGHVGMVYTGAAIEGSLTIDETMLGGPLEAGDYEVRLMRDDGYVTLAVSEPFSVSEPP